jgi:hypothetical protein
MITFSRIGEYGRLGNQLFQYAILLSVGAEKKYDIKLPNIKYKIHHGQKCMLNCFNISAKPLDGNDIIKYSYFEKSNENFTYNPNIFDVPDNTDILGFFQNYQYYKKYENLIIKELTPKRKIIEYNKDVLDKIKSKYPDYKIISIHLRRGDSDLDMYGNDNKLSVDSNWYKYFIQAKEYYKNEKCKFLIFTGGNRIDDNPHSDYHWCKNNLIGNEYIYTDSEFNNSTINDFTLMYLCDGQILSPISSFSWWVGFLNKHKDKTTIAPKKYYFLKKSMTDGFYPDNFILFDN